VNEFQNFGRVAPRECEGMFGFAVITRSVCDEAIQNLFHGSWIASLALAMTVMGMRGLSQIAILCVSPEKLKSN
jgi:hypothetical protein